MFTLVLGNYLSSLVSGAKGVEKESKKLQDHILDIAGPLCMSFEHVSSWQEGGEDEAGSITFFKWNLWRIKYCVASCACLLPVLPPSSNFHVAESRLRFCVLQHENLLRAEMAIRAANNRNLQRNICCATSCKKILPVFPTPEIMRGLVRVRDYGIVWVDGWKLH